MKMKEVKTGEIFNIESTPSYPKLKIDGGYVDMRDEIVNKTGNCDEREVTLMSMDDINKQFADADDNKEWVADVKKKYIA